MLFAIHARDRTGSAALRAEHRDAHLAFLREAGERLKLAGPLLDEEGAMCGSLLVFEAGDTTAVKDWLEDDPYGQAGLFETVTVTGFRPVLGPMAGAA